MMTFCGALSFGERISSFSEIDGMRTARGGGCAFINGEYGVLCFGEEGKNAFLQPVTLRYNGTLYTAVIIADSENTGEDGAIAESVLSGYFEEGEEYLRRLDFAFSLALYDQRCAELLLLKGGRGEKSLFYAIKDGAIYFSSSLSCLMRLYGGCVRIDGEVLSKYLVSDYSPLPYGLFADITPIRSGQGILCTRWGINDVYMEPSSFLQDESLTGEPLEYSVADMRRALTDSLFAFGYPQFDFAVPAILQRVGEARALGAREICIEEPCLAEETRYYLERAEAFLRAWGVRVTGVRTSKRTAGARALRAMDKSLDAFLSELLEDSTCVLHRLSGDILESAREEKQADLRIRKKALLCQTALWFENFNVVLV